MIKVVKNAKVYSPKNRGTMDILIAGSKVAAVSESIEIETNVESVEIIDAQGKLALPGFIDNHVHILGGGGEGGYKTRTPELSLRDLIDGGITTVVGCLGTDGVTRCMESLIAKARGLEEEGVTTYVYSGSYRLPLGTLTGSIQKDLLMVDKIIGIGEVALSDHRSASPTFEEFARAASDARVGGILSGKAGIVNVHMGDGKEGLKYLHDIKTRTEIPATQFLPTHMNRNEELFMEGLAYAKAGGYIDFTASSFPAGGDVDDLSASKAYVRGIEAGVDPSHMTFSSDGQGSLPKFDKNGVFLRLGVGRVTTLYETIKNLVLNHQVDMETAILPITKNPAHLLNLSHKGEIAKGMDADILLLDETSLEITDVMAKGTFLKREGKVIKFGTFEKDGL